MTDKNVWFITGTSRGMGVDFAKAALTAGNAVVAAGRNTDAVSKAVGQAENLLVASWMLPAVSMLNQPCRRPSSALAASTCWSTTRPTSMRAISRS